MYAVKEETRDSRRKRIKHFAKYMNPKGGAGDEKILAEREEEAKKKKGRGCGVSIHEVGPWVKLIDKEAFEGKLT